MPLATGMSLRPAISNSFKALVVAVAGGALVPVAAVSVAEDRRQPDDIELGGFEGVEDRHGIVDTRIGVDQYLSPWGSTHRESRT